MPNNIVTVGSARDAQGDRPSASPIFKVTYGKDTPQVSESKTLYENFENAVKKYASNPCLGSRRQLPNGQVGDFIFKTYQEVSDDVNLLASGLINIGVVPKQRIGISGINCIEWMTTMQACNVMSFHCVPLYDALGDNAIEYIINHAEVVCAFVSADKLPTLSKALDNLKGGLRTIVYWGSGAPALLETIKSKGFQVMSFEEIKALGKEKPADHVPPSPEDLCTIMYTSGTTGVPKGVTLTHEAVVMAVNNAQAYALANNIIYGRNDRMLSYLPLAHIFDRVNEEWFLMIGAAIGYWQGDVKKLVDDISALKPAYFIGVPRVYDRIYTAITSQIKESSGLKQMLFNWAYNRKLQFLKRGAKQDEASPFADSFVFSKIAARFGGKVRAVVSGGAPLSPHVEEFLRVAMCAPVMQGYGLTETSAVSFVARVDHFDESTTVGPPTPFTELRLESVPEMNYDAQDASEPKGEILIRGAANFSGYYKQPELTKEVVDDEGFFHTGDVGMLTKSGGLKIIDRKKNIFKLGQGEYVAVEKLEVTYKKCALVDQIWVYGNSFKNTLVAVVVPSAALESWASAQGIKGGMAEICKNQKANAHVIEELNAAGKADNLKGFEAIRAVYLEPNPFTIEDDLLTPTFKLKRPQMIKKYQKEVDEMYKPLN